VELGGAGEPHAAFFMESRTRSRGWSHVQEIRVRMTILWEFDENILNTLALMG
jgi:hypothetical protein